MDDSIILSHQLTCRALGLVSLGLLSNLVDVPLCAQAAPSRRSLPRVPLTTTTTLGSIGGCIQALERGVDEEGGREVRPPMTRHT